MKNKIRDITVGGQKYAWGVARYNKVRVWKDNKLIFETVNIGKFNITPRTIENLIIAEDEDERKKIVEIGCDNPYIEEEEFVIHRYYNPYYGDNRICKCHHPYYRHFDTYENMKSVGCNCCSCEHFEEKCGE